MKMIVSHPGLQHSHQLAWALDQHGMLAAFWSGVPVTEKRSAFGERFAPLRQVPVARSKRRHWPIFPLVQRLGARLFGDAAARALSHRMEQAYDATVAAAVRSSCADAVIAYENAATRTFEVARASAKLCILDAASVHFTAQRSILQPLGLEDPPWVEQRKARELALADLVLTCSPLARETYLAAGYPAQRVAVVPLGAETFPVAPAVREPGPLHLVFAGSIRRLKGVDVLLDALALLGDCSSRVRLTLIGSAVEPELANRAQHLPNVSLLGQLPHRQMRQALAAHDILVLPSRFDAFGMVVPEALAAGLPVLVSTQVGAKCILDSYPEAGWTFEPEPHALAGRLMTLLSQPELVRAAAAAAPAAAADFTWAAYRGRVVDTLRDFVATRRQR